MRQKKKPNPIPQTMRGKKRYVAFQLISEALLAEHSVNRAVWQTMLKLYGAAGCARQKLHFAVWEGPKNKVIVRCDHKHVDEVKAGILFLADVDGKPVVPKLLKVSGSIGQLK